MLAFRTVTYCTENEETPGGGTTTRCGPTAASDGYHRLASPSSIAGMPACRRCCSASDPGQRRDPVIFNPDFCRTVGMAEGGRSLPRAEPETQASRRDATTGEATRHIQVSVAVSDDARRPPRTPAPLGTAVCSRLEWASVIAPLEFSGGLPLLVVRDQPRAVMAQHDAHEPADARFRLHAHDVVMLQARRSVLNQRPWLGRTKC